jgi:hypothetical protein
MAGHHTRTYSVRMYTYEYVHEYTYFVLYTAVVFRLPRSTRAGQASFPFLSSAPVGFLSLFPSNPGQPFPSSVWGNVTLGFDLYFLFFSVPQSF